MFLPNQLFLEPLKLALFQNLHPRINLDLRPLMSEVLLRWRNKASGLVANRVGKNNADLQPFGAKPSIFKAPTVDTAFRASRLVANCLKNQYWFATIWGQTKLNRGSNCWYSIQSLRNGCKMLIHYHWGQTLVASSPDWCRGCTF